MKSRIILAIITATSAIALAAAPAAAQFTTFVPPKRQAPVDAAVPKIEAEARADSVQAQTLTDMKVWVDSAAKALAVGIDTMPAGPMTADSIPAEPSESAEARPSTTSFSEGAPAPDTATMYPLLAVAALACLGVGALLLRRAGA